MRNDRLKAIRLAARRLMARPQLGRDVFGRGAPEPIDEIKRPQWSATLYDLLTAYARERQKHAMADAMTDDQKRDAILRAAEAGDICAECFCLIPPDAPVAIVHWWMVVRSTRVVINRVGVWKHTHKRLDVPICRDCTASNHSGENAVAESGRCETCERELRHWDFSSAPHFPRACCLACRRLLTNKRNRERRRVTHETIQCAVCGEWFPPRRNDAKTCSSKCRQKLYRETRAQRDGK